MTLTSLRDVRSGLDDYQSKVCSRCAEDKPLSDFYIRRARPCGVQSACKVCMASWTKDHPHRPPTERDKRKRSERQRFQLYGITPDEVSALRTAQDNRCAICGTDDPKGRGDFHVDHCHETGRVRGLLCHKCNFRLGIVESWYLKNKETVDGFRTS